jgi:hypothetical protein
MFEAIPLNRHEFGRLFAVAGAVATLSIGASIYPSSNASAEKPAKTIELTPNMSGFLKSGTKNTCFNGGARPCALLLRVSPELSSNFINANPDQAVVKWPLESYDGKHGDELTIKCYDPSGELVRPYEGNSSSTDWYEVEVPKNRVLNPAVEHDGNPTAMLGCASVEWFNQSKPNHNVAVCANNPFLAESIVRQLEITE